METLIHQILYPRAVREHMVHRWRLRSKIALGFLIVGIILLLFFFFAQFWSWILSLGFVAAVIGAWFWFKKTNQFQFDSKGLAKRVEEEHPDLRALLVTAVEQRPAAEGQGLNYLQTRVVDETVAHAKEHGWLEGIDENEMGQARRVDRGLRWGVGIATVGLLLLGLFRMQLPSFQRAQQLAENAAAEEVPSDLPITVLPGNTEVEKGSRLPISVEFHEDLPASAELFVGASEEELQPLPMIKNLEDPVFGAVIPEVNGELTYQIRYDGKSSEAFKIDVFEFPRLSKATAVVHPPEYAGIKPSTVEDVTVLSVMEKSRVQLLLDLNKEVTLAQLNSDQKGTVELKKDDGAPIRYVADFVADESQELTLILEDEEGRKNKQPAKFAITVVPDQAPVVNVTFPGRDLKVSPLEEFRVEAEFRDDFALSSYGLTLEFNDQTHEIVLSGQGDSKREAVAEHMISMEDLEAQPDQFLSYYFWAEDRKEGGEKRRLESDLFHAEVRPFEKIYRERVMPPSESESQQQQQGDSEEMVKLQKQLIDATWRLKREGAEREGEESYQKDLEVLRDGQEHVMTMAEEALEQAGAGGADEAMLEYLTEAIDHMSMATDFLEEAASEGKAEILAQALPEERKAYQALLRLRAREVEVMRSQSQGAQSRSQSDPELANMRLREEDKRYETERQAEESQNEQDQEQQREELEFLKRLKDLARRQEALSEQIQELQAALELTDSEEEREELKRQLKRLREEQKELVADMDELGAEMNQPDNQQNMASTRRQLEEARNQAQEASENLQQGDPAQAASASNRASETLRDSADELREKTSSQFQEELRQLQDDARQLVENQTGISEKLGEAGAESTEDGDDGDKPKRARPQLASTDQNSPVADAVSEQQKALQSVAERMAEISQASEVSEPLLSEKLYDAIRQNNPEKIKEGVGEVGDLADSGFNDAALEKNKDVTERVEDLKDRIDEAANSILGDQAQALRAAREE
ncbi:MAG: DUF4175 family protein, partial [Verrucomicrobiota bacterium]